MKLTKKRAIELHRELWDWLYHHPSKVKDDWPRWEDNGGDISEALCDCFLCEYKQTTTIESCFTWPCILDWQNRGCFSRKGYLGLWEIALSPKTRKKYAKLIRNLPERKS